MYRDHTLIPSEAIRLLALGILAERSCSYAQLASEVRYFTGRIAGPSLDLVAPPLELLKIEVLIESEIADTGNEDLVDEAAQLTITETGRAELQRLMISNLRAPVNEINKLILALKVRFLHLLSAEDRALQLEVLMEMAERELARLTELRGTHAQDPGHLAAWLDQEIAAASGRLIWFSDLAAKS